MSGEYWGGENRALQTPKSGTEIPKKSPENSYSGSQLNTLRGDIDLKSITNSLRTKIATLNTGLNPDTFIEGIEKQIREKLISQEKIPTSAKELFYSDLKGLITRFEDTMSEKKLRLNQEQNNLETFRNATDKENSPAGRLEFTLRGTFEKYIQGATAGLYAAFVEQKTVGNGIYNETTWNAFAKNISETDAKYPGLDITSYLQSRVQKDYIGDKFLSRDIGIDILKKLGGELSPEAFNSITGNLSRNSFVEAVRLRSSGRTLGSPGYPPTLYLAPNTMITLAGKKVDIVDIIGEYSTTSKEFLQKQGEIGDARDRAISESVIGKIRKTAGLTELKNEFDFLENAEVKKDMSFAALIRIATQMSSIFVPGPGGASDLTSALTAIDNGTGEMLPGYERSICALFGFLDITVAGSMLASIRKAIRMGKFIKMIQRISGKIPAMIEKHLANGGKISKDMAMVLVRFGKSLGKEAGRKIEEMMRKQGLIKEKVIEVTPKKEEKYELKIVEYSKHKPKFQKGDMVEFSNERVTQYTQFHEGKILEFDQKTNKYIIETKNPDNGNINRFSIDAHRVLDRVGSLLTLPYGHGSSSASLFGVIREGGLVPTGILQKKGIIPFSGTMDDGAIATNGVNNHSVSLSFKQGAKLDHQYATTEVGNKAGWNVEDSIKEVSSLTESLERFSAKKKTLGDITNDPSTWGIIKEEIENFGGIGTSLERFKKDFSRMYDSFIQDAHFKITLEKKRQEQFSVLGDLEKELINKPFPIIYKIGASPEMKINFPTGTRGGVKEANALGGVKIENIKGILVPKEKISLVQKILSEAGISHIRVEEI